MEFTAWEVFGGCLFFASFIVMHVLREMTIRRLRRLGLAMAFGNPSLLSNHVFWPTALGNDRIKGADRRVLIGYATAWCVCIGTVFAMLLVQLSRR